MPSNIVAIDLNSFVDESYSQKVETMPEKTQAHTQSAESQPFIGNSYSSTAAKEEESSSMRKFDSVNSMSLIKGEASIPMSNTNSKPASRRRSRRVEHGAVRGLD